MFDGYFTPTKIEGPDKPLRRINLKKTTVTAVPMPCCAWIDLSACPSFQQLQLAIYNEMQTATLVFWTTDPISSVSFSLSLTHTHTHTHTQIYNICNRVYCIHVLGHDPLIFSFLSFILFDCLWPQLSKVLKPVHWASSVPFPPSVPAEAGCLFAVAAGVMCSSQGRAYTVSWLIGVQIKVIATSDLWLFIHASSLLTSTPHPTPLHIYNIYVH